MNNIPQNRVALQKKHNKIDHITVLQQEGVGNTEKYEAIWFILCYIEVLNVLCSDGLIQKLHRAGAFNEILNIIKSGLIR